MTLSIHPEQLTPLWNELAAQGWATAPSGLFTETFCQSLSAEGFSLYHQGSFQKAAIGKGLHKRTNPDIRGDSTFWIDENPLSPVLKDVRLTLQYLMAQLNAHFFLGLQHFETHFSHYPPFTGYQKHIDNHRGTGARRITFILYLNKNWHKGDGGELSLYDSQHEECLLTQIAPLLGTFVLFRSELFPHQVETNYQPRLSLTGWFRNDAN